VCSLFFVVVASAGYMPAADAGWQTALYGVILWAIGLCTAQVVQFGEWGMRSLFVMPAALFVVAVSAFPLIFSIEIAFSNWNLSSPDGRSFNGLDNLKQLISDPFYWNALLNMVYYCGAIIVEYAIAFGLALLLTINLRGRKFFRVAFLLPLMLSPVAVSWLVGKSMLEPRFGPIARAIRYFTGETPSFFGTGGIARTTMMVMDAWMFIPLLMLMLLAGLQSIPEEIHEAAKVDGASAWRRFWELTFPMMLPVSFTAILIRLIFKLKLGDIVINVTAGGPGGATDTVTSFIYREYRDRSNVGYGSMLAIAYLVIVTIVLTLFIKLTRKWATAKY
jgi:multiple sugar transport system permease protein